VGVSRILALRQLLVSFHTQTAVWAVFLSASAMAAYAAAFFGAGYGPLWLQAVCALALGPLIALLFRIAHDAGHGSHFAHAKLDRMVCRLSLLPSYIRTVSGSCCTMGGITRSLICVTTITSGFRARRRTTTP
jgi:fatty acid desaturase